MVRLDADDREIFRKPISPSSWYSCDAFARFLEADIRETAGGNEEELVKRAEAVIEKQLTGIYKMFCKLGSSEFVIQRIAAVHSTYFDGVQIVPERKGPKSGVIQYVGFSRTHRIMGFAIVGFYRKALEISGAKKVSALQRSDRSGAKILRARIKVGLTQTGELITIRFRHDVLRFSVP